MTRMRSWVLAVGLLSLSPRAYAEGAESRVVGIGGSFGAQLFHVTGPDTAEGGVQVDLLQLHIQTALSETLALELWFPVSDMILYAATTERDSFAVRTSAFLVRRPLGDHGLFAGLGLGFVYIAVEEGETVGPEIGARMGWELTSAGRGFSTTIGIHPYYAWLPLGTTESFSVVGVGLELGFHAFATRARAPNGS